MKVNFWEKEPHTHSPPPLSVVGVSNIHVVRGVSRSRKYEQGKVLPGEFPVVGKNTLRTSKLGSDLHADFDCKEITF